jgi:hypothetical protein
MKRFLVGIIMIGMLTGCCMLAGCSALKYKAEFQDGTKIEGSFNKQFLDQNLNGLKATIDKNGVLTISVDKSTTTIDEQIGVIIQNAISAGIQAAVASSTIKQ